jgi:hypothetical protein
MEARNKMNAMSAEQVCTAVNGRKDKDGWIN